MFGAGHAVGSGGNAESGVLDCLEFGDVSVTRVGKHGGTCVSEEGSDEGFVSKEQSVPVLPASGAGPRLQAVYARRGAEGNDQCS